MYLLMYINYYIFGKLCIKYKFFPGWLRYAMHGKRHIPPSSPITTIYIACTLPIHKYKIHRFIPDAYAALYYPSLYILIWFWSLSYKTYIKYIAKKFIALAFCMCVSICAILPSIYTLTNADEYAVRSCLSKLLWNTGNLD